MVTESQILDGMRYAENNFKNDQAEHLWVDKQLIPSLFNLDGAKVLDFGCGMGGMSLWYATKWNCEVLGLDIDGHHIEVANRLKEKHGVKNVSFQKRNILDEAETPERFDYIFMNDVAEHIQLPILEAIFKKFTEILAPTGKLFVTYPPWRSPYASHVYHAVGIPWCQFLPQKMLLKRIEANNMQLVGEEESDLVSAYKGLNHLTHEKLIGVARKAGLTMTYRKSHSVISRLPGMKNINVNFFPFDFLVTKEFALLEVDKTSSQ